MEEKINQWNDSLENKENPIITDYKTILTATLQYPWIEDFLNFFHRYTQKATIRDDEKNLNGGYYINLMLKKEIPNIIQKFENWESPRLRDILIKVFFKVRDSRLQNLANYLTKHAEDFKDLIDRESLKKECPLASKRNDHLFENKTFLESVKQKFLHDYTSKNKEFYNHILNQIKDIESHEELYEELVETVSSIETSDNVIRIYLNEYLLPWVCEEFFADQKKKSSKQQWLQEQKNKLSDEEKQNFINRIIKKEEVELITNTSLLTKEQLNTIDMITKDFISLSEKEQKNFKKYLIRLVIKNKPFKVNQFLEKNNLDRLPENTITLFNWLWIEIIEDEVEPLETLEDKPLDINKSHEISETIKEENNETTTYQQLLELFSKDPVAAIVEQAKSCWYEIENENLLKKQIDAICTSSKYVRNSLLLSLFKDSFTRPILKNSWAFSLEAWWTGYRFVLRQTNNGKFSIVGFYNHDDYTKILDSRKW